ncbi:CRISPR/Cas system-associated RAMP superfamily protein Cas6 [Candidatus Termititenax aidoneus]|uniref:CRISPR/Cas system-associated RAMP superfamily protein Cas6 n=1 Tax=Termititenax aidoneus TaxID=2218524 RepID=A0A388TAY3_TERA1|nr:CRISPR/Cas system-associated RAMP superfamily protein Cas6 [Candidatus Termititenax aidoneus]
MLTSLDIELEAQNGINRYSGSLLHGVLMEKLDADYAEALHHNELQPFSQFLFRDYQKDCYVWRISTLTAEAKENIIQRLLTDNAAEIVLKHNNAQIKILSKNLTDPATYQTLADNTMTGELQRRLVLRFVTPTTFKSAGEFVLFPDVRLVYSSLWRKWNAFASAIALDDAAAQEHLIKHTKLSAYRLRTTRYELEGIRVNSFWGEVCWHVNGPETLARLGSLLIAFASYAGVGAKTALGMGGVNA